MDLFDDSVTRHFPGFKETLNDAFRINKLFLKPLTADF